MDKGQFGKIYKCLDFNNSSKELVMKLSDNTKMLAKEFQTMKDIQTLDKYIKNESYSCIPRVEMSGSVVIEKKSLE